jgi:hypothetical protein
VNDASQSTAGHMRGAVASVMAAVGEGRREQVMYEFGDPERLRWTYLPAPHAGLGLPDMGPEARKCFHRLLATALSRRGFAEAVTVMALEEVLDLDEEGRRSRHRDAFYLSVFGDPGGDALTWRIEGHHLSVTATVVGDQVAVSPLFLGARPHRIGSSEHTTLAPVGLAEDLARRVIVTLSGRLRTEAIVAKQASADILSGAAAEVDADLLKPTGVPVSAMKGEPRRVFDELLTVYLGRLSTPLAHAQRERIAVNELHFAWSGGTRPSEGHAYRIAGPDLLIEYCNTDGDHSHTVMRQPSGDFGYILLAAGLPDGRAHSFR